jgi:predicted alpha/beta hydrolase family esterase
LSEKNWYKLHSGMFFNPVHHIPELTPEKILMFHAKNDPYVPWRSVSQFADSAGIRLHLFARGGHLSTEMVVQKYWPRIARFFAS